MSRLGLVPVFLCVISTLTFIVTYCMSVAYDHVEPFFPYISMTGATRPESAIFGQFLTVTAFLSFASIFIRFKLVNHITREDVRRINYWNTCSLYLGILVCIGITIVANFQATTVLAVHLSGAVMVFGLGWLYAAVQTGVTYMMHPQYNGVGIARARLAVTVTLLLSLVITFVAGSIASAKYKKNNGGMTRSHWHPDDPGYREHIVSAFGEWIMALLQMLYFLTYAKEFFKIEFTINSDMKISHMDEEPVNEALTLTQ